MAITHAILLVAKRNCLDKQNSTAFSKISTHTLCAKA